MIAIDVADLVVIAGDLYGIGPGAALDRLDIDAAQAALAEADLTEGSLAPAARTLASLGAGESEVRGAVTALLAEAGRIGPAPHRIRKPVSRDDEIRRLRQEVARLADLLREHGIEPGTSDRKSA